MQERTLKKTLTFNKIQYSHHMHDVCIAVQTDINLDVQLFISVQMGMCIV